VDRIMEHELNLSAYICVNLRLVFSLRLCGFA
jgi:hypothetical protein